LTKQTFAVLEAFMLTNMTDPAHDSLHIYRVLNTALDIASHEQGVNMETLLAACLLHDIGRERQFANPALCHAKEGAQMAYVWLTEQGWPEDKAAPIRDCISTHRFRGDNLPASLEAKILFDADKLDATGAMAIARTITYKALVGGTLYNLDDEGKVITEGTNHNNSFFEEYNYKLRKVYDRFYTARGRELAAERRIAGEAYYEAMLREVRQGHENGKALLEAALRG
jgi:uncharacterized protein